MERKRIAGNRKNAVRESDETDMRSGWGENRAKQRETGKALSCMSLCACGAWAANEEGSEGPHLPSFAAGAVSCHRQFHIATRNSRSKVFVI